MTDEETDFLKEEYGEENLCFLFDEYLSLKQTIDIASSEDMGKEVIENSKKLEIICREINSRTLPEKINFIRFLSTDLDEPGIDLKGALYCINLFITEFMSYYDESD